MGKHMVSFKRKTLLETGEESKRPVHSEKEKTNLTKSFNFDELVVTNSAKHAEKNYQYGVDNIEKVKKLAEGLETVRNVLRTPMVILSAVRCPELNKAVGGVKTSQHVKCEAADFIIKAVSPKSVGGSAIWWAYKKIRASSIDFDQLIYEVRGGAEWIHISFCDNNRRECLTYDGKKYTRIDPKEILK